MLEQLTPEHVLAAVGMVTTFATLLRPALAFVAARTDNHYDDDAVRLIDKLLALATRFGWGRPR